MTSARHVSDLIATITLFTKLVSFSSKLSGRRRRRKKISFMTASRVLHLHCAKKKKNTETAEPQSSRVATVLFETSTTVLPLHSLAAQRTDSFDVRQETRPPGKPVHGIRLSLAPFFWKETAAHWDMLLEVSHVTARYCSSEDIDNR